VDDAGKLADRRMRMVEEQIVRRGVTDVNVVAAMRSVPRHLFLPPEREHEAYADEALPIGHGQTISQPYMVALMTQVLRVDVRKKILDVGSGSGYQTAVLAEMAGEVFAIERIPELAERSRAVLDKLEYDNVTVVVGDGTVGLPEQAPFDGIVVAAAAPEAPRPLLHQLADGGRLVIPLGPVHREQMLTVFTREGTGFRRDEEVYCRFVPLIGEEALGGTQGDGAV